MIVRKKQPTYPTYNDDHNYTRAEHDGQSNRKTESMTHNGRNSNSGSGGGSLTDLIKLDEGSTVNSGRETLPQLYMEAAISAGETLFPTTDDEQNHDPRCETRGPVSLCWGEGETTAEENKQEDKKGKQRKANTKKQEKEVFTNSEGSAWEEPELMTQSGRYNLRDRAKAKKHMEDYVMDGEFSDSDDETTLTIQQKVSKRLAALETLIMEETGEHWENDKWNPLPSDKKNVPMQEDSWRSCRGKLASEECIKPTQRNNTNQREEDTSEPGHSSWQSGRSHEHRASNWELYVQAGYVFSNETGKWDIATGLEMNTSEVTTEPAGDGGSMPSTVRERPVDYCDPKWVRGATSPIPEEIDTSLFDYINEDGEKVSRWCSEEIRLKISKDIVEALWDVNPSWSKCIEYKTGYLLDSEDSVATSVSQDFAMAVGIPKEFREKFGHVQFLFNQRCQVGEVAVLPERMIEGTSEGPREVYYLITKMRYFKKPEYDDVERCMVEMQKLATSIGVKRISIPRIGCGMDKLSWRRVYAIIDAAFKESDITITVYLFPTTEEVNRIATTRGETWPNLWDETDSKTVYSSKFGWLSNLEEVPFPERDVFSWRPSYLESCPILDAISEPLVEINSRNVRSKHGKGTYHVPPGYEVTKR